jgi:DNA-binding transcriptional MerR regulator
MSQTFSAEGLAEEVNQWCEANRVVPASGQAGERMTVRNVRYYRALGVLDPPENAGGQGFTEKHRLQLVAIRLLQAQGLPLTRIQELLFGRTTEELQRIEKQGLEELQHHEPTVFRPSGNEVWGITPLDDEFMLVSRNGRALGPELRQKLVNLLNPKPKHRGARNGLK